MEKGKSREMYICEVFVWGVGFAGIGDEWEIRRWGVVSRRCNWGKILTDGFERSHVRVKGKGARGRYHVDDYDWMSGYEVSLEHDALPNLKWGGWLTSLLSGLWICSEKMIIRLFEKKGNVLAPAKLINYKQVLCEWAAGPWVFLLWSRVSIQIWMNKMIAHVNQERINFVIFCKDFTAFFFSFFSIISYYFLRQILRHHGIKMVNAKWNKIK